MLFYTCTMLSIAAAASSALSNSIKANPLCFSDS